MIDIYEYPASPPCIAVKVTAKILGLDLKSHAVDLGKGETLTKEFIQLNPFHKIPTINDNGFILSESRSIMTYLVDSYSPADSELYPKDPRKRALVDQMLDMDLGSLAQIGVGYAAPAFFTGDDPPQELVEKAKDVLSSLNKVLKERKFAAGNELTLADISLMATLSYFQLADSYHTIKEYPNIVDYITRTRAKLSPIYQNISDGPVATTSEYVKSLKAKNKK